jgi:hypothetical protein
MGGTLWSVSDVAAWWGAVLATVVFAWDVYKWAKSGPRVVMTVQTHMKMINIPRWSAEATYVTVRASTVAMPRPRSPISGSSITVRRFTVSLGELLRKRLLVAQVSRSMCPTGWSPETSGTAA